jgi:hypothetical protein
VVIKGVLIYLVTFAADVWVEILEYKKIPDHVPLPPAVQSSQLLLLVVVGRLHYITG